MTIATLSRFTYLTCITLLALCYPDVVWGGGGGGRSVFHTNFFFLSHSRCRCAPEWMEDVGVSYSYLVVSW